MQYQSARKKEKNVTKINQNECMQTYSHVVPYLNHEVRICLKDWSIYVNMNRKR